ncbi:MAG: molybdate ABC transporter substrate-binding protein [Candidatus Magnetoovum sp. WYHC-5]|nr:molybdate ABC transporter substrate-binding protein [Candidatus Magnetoovum sp. WYHC-5]
MNRYFLFLKLSVLTIIIAIGVLGIRETVYARQSITVSAAVSLRNAFEEIGNSFEAKNSGVKVYFNFGSSGSLVQQIISGAPADVFAAASLKDITTLEQKGLLATDTKANFASNELVLISANSPKLMFNTFDELKNSNVKKLAIGNPKTVPAGRYAEEVLKHFGVYDDIQANIVYTENVRQVLDYVSRSEVEAGIVYLSDMYVATGVKVITTAPKESHSSIVYPIAVIKDSLNESTARAFVKFVLSTEGHAILEKYGFK